MPAIYTNKILEKNKKSIRQLAYMEQEFVTLLQGKLSLSSGQGRNEALHRGIRDAGLFAPKGGQLFQAPQITLFHLTRKKGTDSD